jgi:SAM-dependent methyltransferase
MTGVFYPDDLRHQTHGLLSYKFVIMEVLDTNNSEARIKSHYTDEYFNDFQKEIGEFGGRANKFLFEDHISKDDVVLDFGCGGGSLLKNLTCKRKIGIELNPTARAYCIHVNGIECFECMEYIPNRSIDVVISSHCLEHTTSPFEIVTKLYEKLRPGGKIVIVVPLESFRHRWEPAHVDNHLYSFSPMNLGNILQGTGFVEIKTTPVFHKWIPGYKTVTAILGFKIFTMLSWVYGWIGKKRIVQVKGVGKKP